MFAPETPEILFQDYGTGKLINGKAHITIDPIFAKNISSTKDRPVRIYIQPRGDCKGTYVTNETVNGFDVIELQGGTSNIEFFWQIVANSADRIFKMDDGTVTKSSFSKVRFPLSPKPNETKVIPTINSEKKELRLFPKR